MERIRRYLLELGSRGIYESTEDTTTTKELFRQ